MTERAIKLAKHFARHNTSSGNVTIEFKRVEAGQ